MKRHVTITIDSDILSYARQYVSARGLSDKIEDLLLKFADEQSGIKKAREEREAYLIADIIPELEAFCKEETNPNAPRNYIPYDLISDAEEFLFRMEKAGKTLTQPDIKFCVEEIERRKIDRK